MDVLIGILLVVLGLTSLGLVFLVLIQDDQGEGLGGLFGGGATNQAPGSRRGNFLTRLTSTLGAIFMITAFVVAFLYTSPADDGVIQAGTDGAEEVEGTPWYATDDSTDSTEQ